MVLPDTDAEGALVVARALMTAIQRLGLPHGAPRAGRFVTLSAGLCTYDACNSRVQDGGDSRFAPDGTPALRASDLLRAAETALHRAKTAGGCQVWSMGIEDAAEPNAPLLCHTPTSVGGGGGGEAGG